MDLSLERLQNRRVYMAAGFIAVLCGAVVAVGLPSVEAGGRCYTETVRCHGVLVAGCIGLESTETSFVSAAECDALENITRRCVEEGRTISCRSDAITGDAWKAETTVFSRTCEEWERVYNLDFPSCAG